ncbi:MAG: cysteine desulfurase [Alphaproteobacteria bacterium]|nr:cysteine desulfurase [Alphaproteobacteria bacterium]
MKTQIYLDYNATAPLRPEAAEAMRKALEKPHNASSVHAFGREGRKMIETAREHISALIKIAPAQIIFSSGATESNNTLIHHFKDQRVLYSAVEHPSVTQAIQHFAQNHDPIPVDQNGVIDLSILESLLKHQPTALVSVMAVNNETGVIQPVKEAAALAHKHGALFHCDAVQAAGRIPLDMEELGIDFLTLSSHKIGGPQGAGALAFRLCGQTPILLHGGGQEKYARPGTENVAAIAGFGAAAQVISQAPPAFTNTPSLSEPSINEPPPYKPPLKKPEELQSFLEIGLCKINNDIVIHGQAAPRVANTTSFALPGTSAETLLMALDLEGIAVSNGSACSSGTTKTSPVLRAMNVDEALAKATIRISTGWATTKEEIDAFLQIWTKVTQRLKI